MTKSLPKWPLPVCIISLFFLSLACALTSPQVEIQPAVVTPTPLTPIIPTNPPTSPPIEPPTPTQPQPTTSPTPTEKPPAPGLPPLDPSDLASVMAWMNALLMARSAIDIDLVVGPQGALFAPYAVGAYPPGYDNGPEIAAELEKAFAGAQPVCLGYDPNFGTAPDKAALYVQGLNFDWPSLGLPEDVTDITTFQFFNLEGSWQLTFIVPMPDWGLPDMSSLQPCP